jgi:melibiose permease
MDIPFWSMIPALSSDTKERVGITVLARIFTSIGFITVSAGYIFFAHMLGGGDSILQETNGLFIFAIIVSVIFVITQIITVTNVKEQITDKFEGKVTLKDIFRSLVDNDQLLVVMVVVLVINFTLYITSGMAIYYITYDIGDKNLFGLFMLVGGAFQVLGSVIYPMLAKRFNRQKMFDVAIYAQFVGFIFLFINAFILSSNVVLLFVVASFIFLGQGVFMVLQTILLSDVVEYGEMKLGRRSEGVVFSVQTFVVKLATGLSLGVIGVGLTVINFIAPIEETPDVFVEQAQSASTLEGMRIMMFILPLFGLLLSKYIFTKKHKIDEDYYLEIIDTLEQRRGSEVVE